MNKILNEIDGVLDGDSVYLHLKYKNCTFYSTGAMLNFINRSSERILLICNIFSPIAWQKCFLLCPNECYVVAVSCDNNNYIIDDIMYNTTKKKGLNAR